MTPIPRIGDRITNYRLAKTDRIAKATQLQASGKTQIYLQFISGGPPFPLSDCTPTPDYAAPLSPADVDAIAFWLQTLAAAGEYSPEDREMLGTLIGAQKAQVWKKLTRQAKNELKRLAGQLDAAERTDDIEEDVA